MEQGFIIRLREYAPSGVETTEWRSCCAIDCGVFANVEGSEVRGGNVQVDYTLRVSAERYSVVLHVRGEVKVVCDRCLELMSLPVDYQEVYDGEVSEEEVDLRWLTYETIGIYLPIVHRHAQGECNGQMLEKLNEYIVEE